jgi:hypothetical protein
VRHAPLMLAVTSGCGEAASDRTTDKAAVEAVKAANTAKDQAMIARDSARLASFYTDDIGSSTKKPRCTTSRTRCSS